MAATLEQKLQLKSGQKLLVMNSPERTFEQLVAELPQASQEAEPAAASEHSSASEHRAAVMLFVTSLAEAVQLTPQVFDTMSSLDLVWVAYPKGGNKVKTDINRDRLAAIVEPTGWRAVRLVAMDEVWSAMRFRPAALVGR